MADEGGTKQKKGGGGRRQRLIICEYGKRRMDEQLRMLEGVEGLKRIVNDIVKLTEKRIMDEQLRTLRVEEELGNIDRLKMYISLQEDDEGKE